MLETVGLTAVVVVAVYRLVLRVTKNAKPGTVAARVNALAGGPGPWRPGDK